MRSVDTLTRQRHCSDMLTLLVFILLGVIILFPVVRFAAFLISNHVSGDLAEIRERLGSLPWPLVRGLATAMAAEPIAIFSVVKLLVSRSERGGEGIPILLTHGLYHNKTAWWYFKRQLRRAGFTNLHTYQYNSFTKDFNVAVAGMESKLDELLGDDPDGRVILVGHSMGGLVSRCVAGQYAYRDRVAALITLGSPHKGSVLAYLGCNRMARGLIPGQYISKRVAEMPDPNCPRLGIYTLTDDYVCPFHLLRTGRDSWEEQICSPMGHVWMLYSREITERVIRFLQDKGID
ncbi:esterase/lipase family protein [Pseudodesulfovibrio sediminis]|uniref:Alpha/beta hydrolase n=1 Tax=Pseudodesulfovibrio sediminis TaxID=2810563 RepID=A0ABN6EVY7_9BACT|nr:alpha/beta fold hydrolase [Pseudodesulfovibrio sediminis]BCS89419.1 alpha/beta hydrolase [Pseudodesulfovibrio sediminis]